MWERACSRRVRCSRWIFCVRNTAFANKADRHPGRSYRSTRYLVGASLLAKRPVQSMDFLRQEYRLREQGGSPPRSLLQEHTVSCGSELAREEAGAVDGFSASGIPPSRTRRIATPVAATGARGTLWERACSRRGRYSRWIFCVRNRLREQVCSYRSTRYLVGASLLAKSPVQSMDFLRQEPPSRTSSLLQEHALPCGSELAREESGAVDGFPASGIPPSRTRRIATPVAPTGVRGILWERACSRRVRYSRWIFCVSQIFTFRADPEQRQPDPQVQQALQQVPQVPGRADQARRRPHRQSPQFR